VAICSGLRGDFLRLFAGGDESGRVGLHTLTMGVTERNPNKPKLAVAGLEGGGNHPKLVAMAELLGMDEHG
jgi:hypothetical protein